MDNEPQEVKILREMHALLERMQEAGNVVADSGGRISRRRGTIRR